MTVKNCPFCDCEVKLELSGEYIKFHHTGTDECFLSDTEAYYKSNNLDDVIKLWNTRSVK